MDIFQKVYEAVSGEYVDEANRRICERLGVDEDSDVELILRGDKTPTSIGGE